MVMPNGGKLCFANTNSIGAARPWNTTIGHYGLDRILTTWVLAVRANIRRIQGRYERRYGLMGAVTAVLFLPASL